MSACAWPVYVGLKAKEITSEYVNADGQLVIVYADGTEAAIDGFADSLNPAIDERIAQQTAGLAGQTDALTAEVADLQAADAAMDARVDALEVSAFQNKVGA